MLYEPAYIYLQIINQFILVLQVFITQYML